MSVVHFVVSFFATGHCVVLLLNFLSTALSLIKDAVLQASMIKNIPTVLFFCVLVVVVHVLYSVVDYPFTCQIVVKFTTANPGRKQEIVHEYHYNPLSASFI